MSLRARTAVNWNSYNIRAKKVPVPRRCSAAIRLLAVDVDADQLVFATDVFHVTQCTERDPALLAYESPCIGRPSSAAD
jgi:hypothetical protein